MKYKIIINAILNIFKSIPLSSAEHDYYNVFLKEVEDFEQLTKKPISELSILVLGCGYRYTDVLLLNQVAKEVIGLDIQESFYKDGFIKLLKNNFKIKKTSLVLSIKLLKSGLALKDIMRILKKYHLLIFHKKKLQ